jgi:dTDP-4-dehydrorhamnose reductase
MKKLLVTGASGFLGWNVCQMAKLTWDVFGTYHSHPSSMAGATLLKVDLTDFQQVKDMFEAVQPTAVIHAAAQSTANTCQTHPQESHRINVTASANLAGLCADYSLPCAFTSTDQVFDGSNPPYRETDSVSPINCYGEQKARAEAEMLERHPQTAVCRLPLMFGAAPPPASSFLGPFIQALREERELRLFTDEFRTPVSATTAARGLLLALEKVRGHIHLGGKERISRYDFGRLMVEVLQLPATGLKACKQEDVPMAAPRPADVSLDSTRAFALGYAPPSLQEELEALRGKV